MVYFFKRKQFAPEDFAATNWPKGNCYTRKAVFLSRALWSVMFLMQMAVVAVQDFHSKFLLKDNYVFTFFSWPIWLFWACTVTQWKIKMQTTQYRRTRIWEIKKDKYTKTLAKNQVCEIFQMRDIGKNGLPKFIKLCMETPCWCPFQEHQYGRRIPTETSVFEFSY